ncbi:MAG: hypothetical protein DPW16_22215 [Chloroflexi bacterium]|nr:hypothetical protein [Chloroflexota bacterium]
MLTSAVISLHPLTSSDTQPDPKVVSKWVTHEVFAGEIPGVGEFCPYTISGVLHLPQTGYYLRITSLTTPTSQTLQAGLKCLSGEITLDQSTFQIRSITTDNTAHRAAGTTTYTRLAMASLKRRGNPHRSLEWTARFLTPTCLLDDVGLPSLLPEPTTLYLDLQNRWEYFTETQLLPLEDFLSRCIEVSYTNLRTIPADSSHETTRHRGFVGVVRYRLKPMESVERSLHKDWQHYLHMLRMLTEFAFYAGVGQEVEVGMGQFRSKSQW